MREKGGLKELALYLLIADEQKAGGGDKQTRQGNLTAFFFFPRICMAILIIVYDLSPVAVSYYDLVSAIKKFPWAKLSASSYAISTNLTPQTVFNQLRPLMDGSSNLYVITGSKPFTGYGPEAVNKWLQQM